MFCKLVAIALGNLKQVCGVQEPLPLPPQQLVHDGCTTTPSESALPQGLANGLLLLAVNWLGCCQGAARDRVRWETA